MNYKPMPHQTKGLQTACKRKNWGFFWDCGTGKTFLGLNIARKAKPQGPTLVVCPVTIIEAAWEEDAAKFAPELTICNMHSRKNKKGKTVRRSGKERADLLKKNFDIYVANFETLKSSFDDIAKKDFYCIIVDESSRMKSVDTQTTKALLALAGVKTRTKKGQKKKYNITRPIPRRFVMSGTPAPNDYVEYWAQVKFVTGPGNAVFHDNFYVFRSRYFSQIPLGFTGQNIYKFRKSMEPEFMAKLAQVSEAITKDDVLKDLPPMTKQKRIITLSKEERAAYDEIEQSLVLEINNEEVLASNTLTQALQLRELTSGFVYSQIDKTPHETGKSKLKELKILLEEIGKKQIIVWANFHYEIKTLLKELPGSKAIWGKDNERAETIAGFKAGDFQYLIANPASAAHGLTFTNATYAIYYSINHSYEQQKQSEDRIRRKGQDQRTTVYFLIAEDTIDEAIYKSLESKADLNNTILSYLKKRR